MLPVVTDIQGKREGSCDSAFTAADADDGLGIGSVASPDERLGQMYH
ncbi:MAG: hypothetical protein ACLQIB_31615 [Isosphaeraceae bacterium]